MKRYEKLEISDPAEIELYKTKLIELHHLGYRRFIFNLKMLVAMREGNDFGKAFEEIKVEEERRGKKREEKRLRRERGEDTKKGKREKREKKWKVREEKDEKKWKVKGEKGEKKWKGKERNKDETREENAKFRDAAKYEILEEWPMEKYSVLYIDGNNMLFMNQILRNNTLGRKKKKSEMIISNAVEEFSSMNHFDLVVVIFDNTKQIYEKILPNGTKFVVSSAIPQYPSSDDALVDMNNNQSEEVRNRSLVVTSDVALCGRLTSIGSHVTKCKMFFNAIRKAMNKNIETDEWFKNIEASIDI